VSSGKYNLDDEGDDYSDDFEEVSFSLTEKDESDGEVSSSKSGSVEKEQNKKELNQVVDQYKKALDEKEPKEEFSESFKSPSTAVAPMQARLE